MLDTTLLRGAASLWLLTTLLLPRLALADSVLRAEQLTVDNWAVLRPQGPDAIAGMGDWALTNGRLCAVISHLDHESGMTAWGGILVDLGHCGAGNDQWLMSHLLPNMDTQSLTRPHSLRTGFGADSAYIVVQGQQQGLRLESRYQLELHQTDTLTVVHTVTRIGPGSELNTLATMFLHPSRALTPYALNTDQREYSLGFDWLQVDRSDERVMLRAMQPGDLTVFMGADGLQAPVSYGVKLDGITRRTPGEDDQVLEGFTITGSDYSLFGGLAEMPVAGARKPGVWEFLQSRWMDLEQGESLEMRFSILVKPDTNVAQITNEYYQGAVISGRLQPANGRLLLSDGQGHPLTTVTPAADGHFRVRVPQDVSEVVARHVAVGHSSEYRWRLDAAAPDSGELEVGVLSGSSAAQVKLPTGYAMRLTFKGVEGTPDPSIGDDFSGANSAGKTWDNGVQTNSVSLAGIAGDPAEVLLPAGAYQVYASRGLEFSVTTAELTVAAGDTTALVIDWPLRVLDTPGLVSADLHVHSAISFDSSMPLQERVRSFAAMGAEILVATEHNRIYDYSELVADMGLADQITLLTGVEFTGMAYTQATPTTNGHSNVFPLRYKPREFSGGLPRHEGVRLRDLMQWTREQSPDALFQLNHPRVKNAPDPGLAYFDHLGVGQAFDPEQALTADSNLALLEPNAAGLRDADFDLLEVLNGTDIELYRLVREDWFSLLRQGLRPVGTANSDSHKSAALVAVPTNYVSMEMGTSVLATQASMLAGLRAGRVIGSNGPQLAVLIENEQGEVATLGDTISGQTLSLQVAVDAADWIPLDTMVVYLNGGVFRTVPVQAGDRVDLALPSDISGFVVVEVTGTPDATYRAVLPDFTPLAFSNPIWLVGDG